MAKSLYFNTNASSPAVALVKGVSTTSPLGTKPEFVLGDNQDYNIYLVDGAGNYDAASGAAGYTVKLALGDPAGVPTSGTFRLGVSTATSGSLENNYHYLIADYQSGDDFSNVGAANNATGVIFTKINGPPNDWTNGSTLIEVTHALNYNATASDVQTALNATYAIGANGVAVTGTNPNFRATWAVAGARYNATLHDNALVPDSSVIVTEETAGDGSTHEVQTVEIKRSPFANQYSWGGITNGWNARLNTNTFAFRQALNGADTAQATLELQITDSGGNRYTRVQVPVTIRHQVIDDSALVDTTLDTAISSTDADNQYVQNRSSITGLTGGGATNLDGIATANGAATTGWLAAVRNSDTTLNIYRLVSGTDSESSPDVIRPDDYATTTNERVWKRESPTAHAALHVTGGADEVDGDKLDIDWNPSGYTPTTAPSEADSADNLTAHLAGIDNRIGARETVTYGASVAIDMDASPYQEITLTGDITISTTNRAGSGRAKAVAVIFTASGADRVISLDASINILGVEPGTLGSGKVGVLSLTSLGSSESNTIAAYAQED